MTRTNGKPIPAPTKDQLHQFSDLIINLELSRAKLYRQLFDTRRNIADECGYPQSNPSAEEYYHMYHTDPIAARVIELLSKECWQVTPWVYESEEGDEDSEFDVAWEEFLRGFRPNKSWHKDEQGSLLWDYFERLDILSGIGRYGVMLLGYNDVANNDLSQPVRKSPELRLNFIRVFPENLAQIASYETDFNSPRLGLPFTYNLTFNDPREGMTGLGIASTTSAVHWTRVIHVPSDGATSPSEFLAPERCRQVLERLLDLRKIYGASAEGYWKACFTLLTAETHPNLGSDPEINELKMKNMFESMMNGLQRTGVLSGMTLKSTAPAVVDPSPHIDKHIEAICVKLGCPVPVFKGYEIGEQASTENRGQWDDRVMKRHHSRCTPLIIAQFVDRMIEYGILPEPEGYHIEWPDLSETSEETKAKVSLTIMQAISQYVGSGAHVLMTPFDFFSRVLNWPDDISQGVVDSAMDSLESEETGPSPLTGLATGVTGVIELFKAAKEGAVTEDQLKSILVLFFRLSEDQADEVIADGLTPASIEAADPTPADPVPMAPVKLKEGEELVDPNPIVGGGNG